MSHRPATTLPGIQPTPAAIDNGGDWSRRRLLTVLVAVLVAAVLLVVGFAYAVQHAVSGNGGAASEPVGAVAGKVGTQLSGIPDGRADSSEQRRDRIAAAPMLAVPASAARPMPPAGRLAETISIPAATRTGPALVPSGFPRTPQGAIGQLAAIETTVLEAMSIPVAHAVHDRWALPGGVGAEQWSMTGHVQAFLGAARMGLEKDLDTVVLATPAGAQIKGTDGPDWVLACVLLEVRAVIESDARIGYGHCERMQWQPDPDPSAGPGGRWMIGPGDPPVAAPSTWPGSEQAITAGWKRWAEDGPTAAEGRD